MAAEWLLKYGMNPHQAPARVIIGGRAGEADPLIHLNGTASFVNLLDALNAWQLVRELKQALALPAAASFKHVSPAGAAVAVPIPPGSPLRRSYGMGEERLSPLATAYARARGADRMASFGDWAAFSDPVDVATAELLRAEISDGAIAPGYAPEALDILKQKKRGGYVILQIDPEYRPERLEHRQVFGITLEQPRNDRAIDEGILKRVVTGVKEIPADARRDLIVATIAIKYTQSNSVGIAYDGQVVGIGAGQQSRIHCTRLAAEKADIWALRQHPKVLALPFKEGLSRPDIANAVDQYLRLEQLTEPERRAWDEAFEEAPEPLTAEEREAWLAGFAGLSLSSDGFIPFRDNIDRAYKSGVRYIVQPGGSLRDADVIGAANEYGMVMAFSGLRLFHH